MSWLRRLRTILVAAVLAGLVASPAAADPAGPTHYRSTVTAVEAADGGEALIDVDVLGGDSFLTLEAEPGVVVEVPGYDGEPYLRIEPDGAVMLNQRSPARWINDARYGVAGTEIPPVADPEAPPSWAQVADGGEYAWHDHRIHHMSPSLPDAVDPSEGVVEPVFDWGPVPLTVDGRDVNITGELVWVPGPPPLVPIALLGAAVVAASLLFLRRPGTVPVTVLAVAAVTAVVGSSAVLGLPAGSDGRPALLVLPGIAAVLAVVGAVWRRRDEADQGWLVAAGGVPLLAWGVLQAGALTRPIVPGWLSVWWVRGAAAVAIGVGAAALLLLLRRVTAATRRDVSAEL